LTGTCLEVLREEANFIEEPQNIYRGGNGFYIGNANDFNPKYALDETRFWHFLEETQKKELEKLQRSSDWKLKILQRYDRMVKKYGILPLISKGLEV
jgi:type I restriction enzyme R subunit